MTVAFTNILNVLPSKELYTWEKFMQGGGAQCEEKKEKKIYFLVIQFDVQLGHKPTLCSSTQNNKRQPLSLQAPLDVLFFFFTCPSPFILTVSKNLKLHYGKIKVGDIGFQIL